MPPAPTNGDPNTWLLDELADNLASSLGFTIGTNLFVNELPGVNMNGQTVQGAEIYLTTTPSSPPDAYIDTETYMIDIWTMSASTKTAYELQRQIFDILHRKSNYALVNWYVYTSLANGIINAEGRSQENDALFSQSFTFIVRNLNNIS